MPTLQQPTTRRFLAAAIFALSVYALTVRFTIGQQPPDSTVASPRLSILQPCGGKIGSVVEISCVGADLEAPEALLFNHPDIKAELLPAPEPPPPMTKKQKDQQPPPPQVVKFKVTIGANVPPGCYDARLVGKHGVSNPRAFLAGDLNEVLEKEPNNDLPEAQRIEINTTINGNLTNPTDVDYYVFAGKRNQRVVLSCLATTIDSRMHPAIEVYGAKSKQLAFNRGYNLDDALADVTLPEDGDYYVRLYQFTHTQGSAEHFYRLSITTAPWIDAIYPATIEPGKTVRATIYGRNLPGGQLDPAAVVEGRTLEKITVDITAPYDPAATQRLNFSGRLAPNISGLNGCFEYRVKNGSGSSNPFMLSLATAPVVLDNEKNRTIETAQEVKPPCEIVGRVQRKNDRDWYVFSAKKGEVYNIDLLSDRLGVAGLMYFVLRNYDTKANIFDSQDNPEQLSIKFFARSDDPQPYRFVVPADGKYALLVASRLADLLARAAPVLSRVRLTPEQPDFELVATPYSFSRPEAATLNQGGQQAFTVFAWRRDGFNGEIALSAEGLPKGVTYPPQALAAGMKQGSFVLGAAADAPAWIGAIKIKGTATIKGRQVTKEARSGGITWQVQPQQNLAPISRVERQTFLAVRDKAAYTLTATLDKSTVVQGTNTAVKVKLTRVSPEFKSQLTVIATLGDLPPGVVVNNNNPITIPADKTDGTLNINIPANAPPGSYNLVLRGSSRFRWVP